MLRLGMGGTTNNVAGVPVLPSGDPYALTNLQRERHAQDVLYWVKRCGTDDLRKVRAWLLDVVQGRRTVHLDMAIMRGSLVHAEIEAREASVWCRFRRILTRQPANGSTLTWLSGFSDLPAPKNL